MKAIVFDVDDTLYDLSTPFKQTCREIFPEDTDLDLEGAFLASRRYSDSVYARCLSGEMSMEEMYIYRFKNAFLDYGKKIDALKALEFQAIYEEKQHEIKMTDAMRQLMQNLKEKVTLGIITNGPAQHQWDKVNALGVTEWIPVGHVFISGALGVAKPDKRIFSRAAERMGILQEEICYVGDSFENDIVGAKAAGWNAVWYNHRGHQAAGDVKPDAVVRSEAELIACLEKISTKEEYAEGSPNNQGDGCSGSWMVKENLLKKEKFDEVWKLYKELLLYCHDNNNSSYSFFFNLLSC